MVVLRIFRDFIDLFFVIVLDVITIKFACANAAGELEAVLPYMTVLAADSTRYFDVLFLVMRAIVLSIKFAVTS